MLVFTSSSLGVTQLRHNTFHDALLLLTQPVWTRRYLFCNKVLTFKPITTLVVMSFKLYSHPCLSSTLVILARMRKGYRHTLWQLFFTRTHSLTFGSHVGDDSIILLHIWAGGIKQRGRHVILGVCENPVLLMPFIMSSWEGSGSCIWRAADCRVELRTVGCMLKYGFVCERVRDREEEQEYPLTSLCTRC